MAPGVDAGAQVRHERRAGPVRGRARRRPGRSGTGGARTRRRPPPRRPIGAPWRPAPRSSLRGATPRSELTASKSRPMLEVGTQPVPRSSWRSSTARSSGSTARAGGRSVRPVDAGRPQVRQRGRGRACGWRRPLRAAARAEVPDPVEGVVAGDEDLAAPDGAVGAVARAVEGDADHPLPRRDAVLGHDRRDVGVVVLHLDHGGVGATRRPIASSGTPDGRPPPAARRRCRRARRAGGSERSKADHVSTLPMSPMCWLMNAAFPAGEAERVLELAADGQCRCGVEGEPDRQGRVAPRPAERHDAAGAGLDLEHGVVAGDVDGPVVQRARRRRWRPAAAGRRRPRSRWARR